MRRSPLRPGRDSGSCDPRARPSPSCSLSVSSLRPRARLVALQPSGAPFSPGPDHCDVTGQKQTGDFLAFKKVPRPAWSPTRGLNSRPRGQDLSGGQGRPFPDRAPRAPRRGESFDLRRQVQVRPAVLQETLRSWASAGGRTRALGDLEGGSLSGARGRPRRSTCRSPGRLTVQRARDATSRGWECPRGLRTHSHLHPCYASPAICRASGTPWWPWLHTEGGVPPSAGPQGKGRAPGAQPSSCVDADRPWVPPSRVRCPGAASPRKGRVPPARGPAAALGVRASPRPPCGGRRRWHLPEQRSHGPAGPGSPPPPPPPRPW